MNPASQKHIRLLVLGLATGLLATHSAHAANGTWTSNANNNWSNTGSWSGGTVADSAGSTADFSTLNITNNRTITFDGSRTLGIFKIGDTDTTNRYIFAGTGSPALTFDNGGSNAQLDVTATAGTGGQPSSQTFNNTMSILLNSTLDIGNASGGALTINSAITGNFVGTVTIRNRGTGVGGTSLAGAIADGSGGKVVAVQQNSGTSSLTLGGASANTYAGGTTVSLGTLTASKATALGSTAGNTLVSGGTLTGTVANVNVGNLTVTSGVLDANGAGIGTYTLASGKNFVFGGGTFNSTLVGSLSSDRLVGSGSGGFTITGGTLALDVTNVGFGGYGITYTLLSGFATGSVSGLAITGYDTANWAASLGNDGVLSFSAAPVPEPASAALLAGAGLLGFAGLRRRRTRG